MKLVERTRNRAGVRLENVPDAEYGALAAAASPLPCRTVWSRCRSAGRDWIDADGAALIPDHGGALSTDTERGIHRDFYRGLLEHL